MDITRVTPGPVPAGATEHRVPMRDGVCLTADVTLPEGPGPWPAVLIRLPYDKNGEYCFMDVIAANIVGRGYAAVVQDVRGKFRSEGATEFGIHEVDDGYDTIEWVAGQEWCDGDVVMIGDSYFGLTQLCAAISGHPALKAIAPRLTGTGLSTVVHYADGGREAEQTARRAYFATHYVENDTYDWEPDWSARPLNAAFEDFFGRLGRRSPAYDHEVEAPDSHRGPMTAELIAARPLPTLFTIGWYDNCAVWSWPDVEAMLADERWAPSTWLWLEAVDHENNRLRDEVPQVAGQHDEGDRDLAAVVDRIVRPSLDFFDYHLGRGGAEPERAVFEVARGATASASAWPPPEAVRRELYAVPAADARFGALAAGPRAGGPDRVTWRTSGEDLVPSIAKDPFALLAHPRRDLAPDTLRDDVAAFETEALAEEVTLAGPVQLTGTLSADRSSVDLFVRLLDVEPDGRAWLIARGSLRIDAAASPAPFRARLLHTAYRLLPGHRIRLHLASSDFPEYVPNPGDGSDPWAAERVLPAEVTVLADAEHPLRLEYTTLG